MEFFKPRKHEPIKTIIEKAKKGDAFFVNRAVLNGDLNLLPEDVQGLIVAKANDEAARYASEQIIPLKDEEYFAREVFINSHLDRATKVFTRAEGKSLRQQIEDYLK